MKADEKTLRGLVSQGDIAGMRAFLELLQGPMGDAPGKGRHANRHAQAKRNEKIVQLAAEGKSQQEIAAEVNLAQSTVSDVLRKNRRAAQKPG